MHRVSELFAADPDSRAKFPHLRAHPAHRMLSAVIIESRFMSGEALLHALRFVAPDVELSLVQNVESIDTTVPKIAIYNFVDRGCDMAFAREAVQVLRSKLPNFPLVIITEATDLDDGTNHCPREHWVPESLGINGLVSAIRLAASNTYVPAAQTNNDGSLARPGEQITTMLNCLTAKETSILRFVHEGRSNKSIAYEMKSSESTVKVHISNMMRKLGIHNRTKLALLYDKHNPAGAQSGVHSG